MSSCPFLACPPVCGARSSKGSRARTKSQSSPRVVAKCHVLSSAGRASACLHSVAPPAAGFGRHMFVVTSSSRRGSWHGGSNPGSKSLRALSILSVWLLSHWKLGKFPVKFPVFTGNWENGAYGTQSKPWRTEAQACKIFRGAGQEGGSVFSQQVYRPFQSLSHLLSLSSAPALI